MVGRHGAASPWVVAVTAAPATVAAAAAYRSRVPLPRFLWQRQSNYSIRAAFTAAPKTIEV